EGEHHYPEEQHDRVVGNLRAEVEDLGEDEQENPEQHQRADQRPDVAEYGAVVGLLEVRRSDEPQKLEEPPSTPAQRGRTTQLAQLLVGQRGRLRRDRQTMAGGDVARHPPAPPSCTAQVSPCADTTPGTASVP